MVCISLVGTEPLSGIDFLRVGHRGQCIYLVRSLHGRLLGESFMRFGMHEPFVIAEPGSYQAIIEDIVCVCVCVFVYM